MRLGLLASLVLVNLGCGQDVDRASRVTGLRLLGARAEPPEAGPADQARLTAWVVDPLGREIDVQWSACLLPQVPGTGTPNPECITRDRDPELVPLGIGATIDAALPAFEPESLGAPDITGGRYLPIRVRVRAGADMVDGIYRLRVRGAGPANANPVLSAITLVDAASAATTPLDEATPLFARSGTTVLLRALFSPDSAEGYEATNTDGSAREAIETLSVLWYATAGTFRADSTGDGVTDPLKLDHTTPGETVDLWVVGLDERGGADLQHRQIFIGP